MSAQPQPTEEHWKATEAEWEQLKLVPQMRLWRLVALSLGAKPEKGVSKRFEALPELRERHKRLLSLARNSLTADSRPNGLRYIKGAENDIGSQGVKVRPDDRIVALGDFVSWITNLNAPHYQPVESMLVIAQQVATKEMHNGQKDGRSPTAKARDTKQSKTLARLTLALLARHYRLEISTPSKEPGRPYDVDLRWGGWAEIQRAVHKLESNEIDDEAIRTAVNNAIDMFGAGEVRRWIEGYG